MIKSSTVHTDIIPPSTDVPSESSIVLPIVETFHSVQGEGFWTGTNAFFIRLAGCNVGCPWCDTKHSWHAERHPQQDLSELVTEARAANPQIVIITGGEPLMHDLSALTARLKAADLSIHLETSGSYPFSGDFDWVTFSPKRFKLPHPSVYPHVSELKVVIVDESDLVWAEQQDAQTPPHTVKVLQPEWGTPGSRDIVFNYVLKHPEWRISLQTHKFLGVQ